MDSYTSNVAVLQTDMLNQNPNLSTSINQLK